MRIVHVLITKAVLKLSRISLGQKALPRIKGAASLRTPQFGAVIVQPAHADGTPPFGHLGFPLHFGGCSPKRDSPGG
eukprot:14211995-Alexandrium_andersonii.AAC.1